MEVEDVRRPIPTFLINGSISSASGNVHSRACKGRAFVCLCAINGTRQGVIRTRKTSRAFLQRAIGRRLSILSTGAIRRRLRVQACPAQLARFRTQDLNRNVTRVLHNILRFLYVSYRDVRYQPLRPTCSNEGSDRLIRLLHFKDSNCIRLRPLVVSRFRLFLRLYVACNERRRHVITNEHLSIVRTFLVHNSSVAHPFRVGDHGVRHFFFHEGSSAQGRPSSPLHVCEREDRRGRGRRQRFGYVYFRFCGGCGIIDGPIRESLLATDYTVACYEWLCKISLSCVSCCTVAVSECCRWWVWGGEDQRVGGPCL